MYWVPYKQCTPPPAVLRREGGKACATMGHSMRIVALSDQHGHLPAIPPCDLLIIAGDVCPDRFGPYLAAHAPEQQQAWFDRHVRPWLAAAPAGQTVLTWGNHDWCGETESSQKSEDGAPGLRIVVDDCVHVQHDRG